MSDPDNPKSIPADAVRDASSTMLQQQLYAIFTKPVDGLGAIFANLDAHLAFQVQLEREGTLYAAGPMWTEDEQDWHGDGMVVIRAPSRAAAIAIAQRDPMHKAGARQFTVRPWMVNEGSVTVRLKYSTQTFDIK